MPRMRIIVMCAHLVTASCYYFGLFVRIVGVTTPFSSFFFGMFTLGAIIGPTIYVVYNVTQSIYISYWIYKHMQTLTHRADSRGQNFQRADWMPRLRRLYWIQILLCFADLTAITTTTLGNLLALDAWWVLTDVAVSIIFVECLAIGYIFIELRGISLSLSISNERQVQAHVKLDKLGRGVRNAVLETVKLARLGDSSDASRNAASEGGATPIVSVNQIDSKRTGASIDQATQLIQSRQERVFK